MKTTLLVIAVLTGVALVPSSAAAAVCADFPNQAAAQAAANTRDADGDGIYCESLPCPCSTGSGSSSPPPPPAAPPPPSGTSKPSCSRPSTVQRLRFSAARYPNIRRHTVAAIAAGWPRILVVNRPGADARRDRLLDESGLEPRSDEDRDEYPPAVGRGRANGDQKGLVRGINPIGWMASVRYVPDGENQSHGSSLGRQLRGLCNGTRFRYVFGKMLATASGADQTMRLSNRAIRWQPARLTRDAAAATAAARCGLSGAKIVGRGPGGVLVSREDSVAVRYWACLKGRRAVRVGWAGASDVDEDQALEHFAFGGRFFAIETSRCWEGGCASGQVRLFDLRSRRRLRAFELNVSAAKLLVGTHGGVAVVERNDDAKPRRIRVWDARGVTVVTKIPPAVRLATVRVTANLLRWTQNGTRRSFAMRGAPRRRPGEKEPAESRPYDSDDDGEIY